MQYLSTVEVVIACLFYRQGSHYIKYDILFYIVRAYLVYILNLPNI